MKQTTLNSVAKRVRAREFADAERYATAQCSLRSLRYAPDAVSQERTAHENARLREGLCIHGKLPRLVAEGLSRVLGYHVNGCKRCA